MPLITPAPEPNWGTFVERIEALAEEHRGGYVLRADVASFYVGINRGRLIRTLLELGADASVVRDLEALLRSWHAQGLRGLPQGLPPSVPLANAYLLLADTRLDQLNVRFVRHSDDLAIFCRSFAHARAVLDALERRLYAVGLTLGGEKTRIWRTSSLDERLRTAAEQGHRAMADFAAEYDWDAEDITEAEHELAITAFDSAVAALLDDRYERGDFIWAFRRLARFRDPHALPALPDVLRRMPGLTADAMAYVSRMTEADRPLATEALERTLRGAFHREQEWLHLLRALTIWRGYCSPETVDLLARAATQHGHPLVRAKAMVAWCRQSRADHADIAEAFFSHERRMWQGYAVMAVRDKEARNALYTQWRSEGRNIARLIDSLAARPIAWSKT